LTSPDFSVVPTQRGTLHQTLTKLSQQTGGASYIDCLVMATADEYQTTDVFGFDETFRKNGYTVPGTRQAA
jgi:predicted nucleic acid-binding protein